ncbi:DUF1302 family protein [Iodobacter fluviatilis]|uniref:Protein of uncharacterized function (DUF1302) n=1 Tax=Iodobacter fluviatilis TaxID=537 RepID=A0A377QB15_9NEIS|nr:DUF1302 family protein [Iodobacter fluviatilis]TCU81798.1 uncharacterized protein DUF1302 [Iodobacter fluviatilis]STQ91905.1 Protein of uncharacterised function (DUF1302) [Iodobacter fluviatilis]
MKQKRICTVVLLCKALLFAPLGVEAGELVFGNMPSGLGEGIKVDSGDVQIELKGALGISTIIRAESPDSFFTSGKGMSTHNDGDLNYEQGDVVSQALDAYLQANLSAGNYGLRLSGKAWYDPSLLNNSVPHGHVSNDYSAGPLNDSGFAPLSQFSGVQLHDAYRVRPLYCLSKSARASGRAASDSLAHPHDYPRRHPAS